MKSLEQIEPRKPISSLPFVISEPGSYYLTGNLQGSDAGGITITTPGVTLDLMGFELAGGLGHGITVAGPLINVQIRNGIIRGWSGAGIFAPGASNSLWTNLRISDNGAAGLEGGQLAIVSECISDSNAGSGFILRAGASIRNCLASRNGNAGFSVSFECLVQDSIADGNHDDGIVAAIGSTVRHCVSRNNDGDGIQVQQSCLVVDNHADGNGGGVGAGVHVTANENRIDGNNLGHNGRGLYVEGPTNLVIRNTARGNAGGNFEIAAGNRVGAIAVPTVSGAISGNGPAPGSGTTDPMANVAY